MAWQPSYTSVAELKTILGITSSNDDAIMDIAIAAASRAVDRFTSRQFGLVAAPEQRLYTGEWDRRQNRWVVYFDDLMSPAVTGISATVTAGGGAINVFDLKPANAVAESKPFTHMVIDPSSTNRPTGKRDEVAITAQWGWTAVPIPIKQATVIQASRFFKRKDAPFGIAGSPELGSELRLLAKIDPDVAVALGPYTRWWSAA